MNFFDDAKVTVETLAEQYNKLTESEKFGLGKIFREATGGKLSPYNSPQPVAVALIPVENKSGSMALLAGRRSIAPKIGEIALPSGFFEANEHGQEAVAREVFEEIGLKLKPENFITFHVPKTSPTNNTLIFFLYTEIQNFYVDEVNKLMRKASTQEMSEIVLITENDKLAFPFHEDAVKDFFQQVKFLIKNGTLSFRYVEP